MIFVYKSSTPPKNVLDALQRKVGRGKSALTEIEAARKYYTRTPTPTTAFGFKRYKEHEVCVELNKIFAGKCAYCESPYNAIDSRDIEHYRPKGKITEEPTHSGYWWLAADWNNLLVSCPACNQYRLQAIYRPGMTAHELKEALACEPTFHRGKGCHFPLQTPATRAFDEHHDLNKEEILLINPSSKAPSTHLRWIFDWDQSLPVWEAETLTVHLAPAINNGIEDPRGRTSIEIYGLDRLELFRARITQLKIIQDAMASFIDCLEDLALETEIAKKSVLLKRFGRHKRRLKGFCRKEAAYAGMARAFVRLSFEELKKYGK